MTPRGSGHGRVRLPPERRRRRRPPSAQTRRIRLATALAVAAVFAITLVPGPSSASSPGGACLVCGHFAAADFLLNVALYVPLGFLPALRRRWPALVIWGVLAALAGSIEVVQLALPGRYASVADVVANAAGAGLGVLLARSRSRWLPAGGAPDSLAFRLAAGAAAGLVFLVSSLALGPSLPSSTWYGQWTPALGHYETYGGEVREARIGDRPLPAARLAEPDSLRAALLGGAPVEVAFRGGPRTAGVAPVVAIYDEAQREVLLVGVERGDLLLRVRRRASDLRLKSPQLRVRGAAPGPGEETMLLARMRDGSACLTGAGGESCEALAPPARGWSLLFGPAPRGVSGRGLDAAFAALLLVPLGLWWRRDGAALAGVGLAAAGAAVGALAGGAGPGEVVTALAGGAVGVGIGAALRRGVARLSALSRARPRR